MPKIGKIKPLLNMGGTHVLPPNPSGTSILEVPEVGKKIGATSSIDGVQRGKPIVEPVKPDLPKRKYFGVPSEHHIASGVVDASGNILEDSKPKLNFMSESGKSFDVSKIIKLGLPILGVIAVVGIVISLFKKKSKKLA